MKIEEQTKLASKFTSDLLKYILRANKSSLNKDGNGCWVKDISILYYGDSTSIEVGFGSQNKAESPVLNFVCKSTVYHY